MKPVVISGKFLTKPINGIPRYAMEIVKHLDPLAEEMDVTLCYPADLDHSKIPALRNIKLKALGRTKSGWDQTELVKYCRKNRALLVNLTSTGTLYRNSIVCVHDIRPLTWDVRNNVSLKRKMVNHINFALAIHSAKQIVTDSLFSRTEIAGYYRLPEKDICVIPCGWEHLNEIPDIDCPEAVRGIESKSFYFAVGSMAPHKNFEWIIRTAKNNPDARFLIAGNVDKSVWNYELDFEKNSNVTYLGYISDEEMKWYMKDARMLLFPSFYEGFGIPPLEALALGTDAVVADIPVLRETFGEAVYYVDPYASNVILYELQREPVGSSEQVIERNTWTHAALQWKELLMKHC